MTTPVRIVARLFGAPESAYCTPWKKEELAAKKAAKAQQVAQAPQKSDEVSKPVVVAAKSAR